MVILGHPDVVILGNPGVILSNPGVIKGSSRGHPWFILGSSLGHPVVILGSTWHKPGSSYVILNNPWSSLGYPVVILGLSGIILSKLCLGWVVGGGLDYLNINCLIFDLLMFSIFSSTHPPKTNNISSDWSAQTVWLDDWIIQTE